MNALENKVAIVTGGGSGIGRASAILLATEGAKVVIADIDVKGSQETVNQITSSGGEAIFIKTDTSKPREHELLVEQTVEKYGGLHIVCNNAGIGGPLGPVGEYPIDGWDKVIAINLSGVFYGMHYQIPAMLKSGGGSIVNLKTTITEPVQITVYDQLGKVVYTGTMRTETQIDLSHVAQGVYHISMISKQASTSEKIIIKH